MLQLNKSSSHSIKLKKTSSPIISVVMPVYNSGTYLSTAINSIINQTFLDWELIIVDDGSSDNSLQVARSFANFDRRISVHVQSHKGVASTANYAISLAKGQFIARMDADDVAFPQRLQKQISYLKQHPKTIALGAQCLLINEQAKTIGKKTFPTSLTKIREMMFYYYPLQQPTLMVNTALLPKDFVWYPEGLQAAEEHELLFKLLKHGAVTNLPNYLLFYRLHAHNTTKLNPKKDFLQIFKTRARGVYYYGYLPSFKAVLFSFVQLLTIGLLPRKLIFPLYSKLRGLE